MKKVAPFIAQSVEKTHNAIPITEIIRSQCANRNMSFVEANKHF